MSTSRIRQNYHPECEAAINKQINCELYASYVYQSMAWFFDRDDVALPGFHQFFSNSSKEEREHAEKMMKYQNERGGSIVLQPIDKPHKETWGNGLEAMKAALELEKTVNQSLLDMHKLASSRDDAHLTNWLEGEFLEEQVKASKQLSEYITRLTRAGSGLGEHLIDHELSCSVDSK